MAMDAITLNTRFLQHCIQFVEEMNPELLYLWPNTVFQGNIYSFPVDSVCLVSSAGITPHFMRSLIKLIYWRHLFFG